MKLPTLALVIAAITLGSWESGAGASEHFDGIPVLLEPVPYHLNGQPGTAQLLVLQIHLMNGKGAQPIGFWMYFYILSDATSGNFSNCQRWSNQVLLDQSRETADSDRNAWMEVSVSDSGSPSFSDEGYNLIPASDISCWEAIEFAPQNP